MAHALGAALIVAQVRETAPAMALMHCTVTVRGHWEQELAAHSAERPHVVLTTRPERVGLLQHDNVSTPRRVKIQLVAVQLWEHDQAIPCTLYWPRETDAAFAAQRQRVPLLEAPQQAAISSPRELLQKSPPYIV